MKKSNKCPVFFPKAAEIRQFPMNTPPILSQEELGCAMQKLRALAAAMNQVLFGQKDLIELVLIGVLARGHILLEGLPIPSAEDVAAMLDYADPALREKSFTPYYLYRQKYMSGSFENVGWCISGAEGLYNIYIMEELHSILSLGAGGSTKMVDAKRNRIERVFHPKFPLEYIQRPEKLTENLEAFRRFHQEMAR